MTENNYCSSGHGIGFNGRWEDNSFYADIIDSNGILRKKVWTYYDDPNPNGYYLTYVTSVFDLPPEMKDTLRVPYIHFTMEPHVG